MSQHIDDDEPLATALTRPTSIMGIPLDALLVSLVFPVMATTITHVIWMLLLIPIMLGGSWWLALKDPHFMGLLWAATNLRGCPNAKLWGARCYAPH